MHNYKYITTKNKRSFYKPSGDLSEDSNVEKINFKVKEEEENIPDTNRRMISKDIDDIEIDYNFIRNLKIDQKDKKEENINNEFDDDSKKNLSQKIISIINSSGTQDEDMEMSDTGNYKTLFTIYYNKFFINFK